MNLFRPTPSSTRPRSPGAGWTLTALGALLLADLNPLPLLGAERAFDLTAEKLGEIPKGFISTVAGSGPVGTWKLQLDEIPPTFAPLTAAGPQSAKIPVIAQLSEDPTDERFPLLILDDTIYADFTLKLRFKLVRGTVEQMAGIVFRYQDEKNFYVARVSGLGRNVMFYAMQDGQRSPPVGNTGIEIPSGVWQDFAVTCEANRIRITLNGQPAMPELNDSRFREGKIGLWTKSDAVAHFTDLRLEYRPREAMAVSLIRDTLARYPRLLGLRLYSTTSRRPELHVVAAKDPADVGQPAGKYERQALEENQALAGKSKKVAIVTMPLHDRNGDPIGVVRFEMESFPGQTDVNAVGRATPIIKFMQSRVITLKELTE